MTMPFPVIDYDTSSTARIGPLHLNRALTAASGPSELRYQTALRFLDSWYSPRQSWTSLRYSCEAKLSLTTTDSMASLLIDSQRLTLFTFWVPPDLNSVWTEMRPRFSASCRPRDDEIPPRLEDSL